ncbi:MAG: M20/M25/M40 family metallo-hydrolase [Gemmatimonadota bacterium]
MMPSTLRCCTALVLASALLATAGASQAAAQAAPPDVDIFLVPLTRAADGMRVGAPLNITRRAGYDNQPSFMPDSRTVLYTSNRGDGQTDIYRHDLSTGVSAPMFRTMPESEYSAFAGRAATTVIRVEADSTQRLWQFPSDGGAPRVLFPAIKPVGYFAQADDSTWALFVLGSPATLQLAVQGRDSGEVIARNIGRSLHRIPGSNRVSYVQKGTGGWHVMMLDPRTRRVDTLVRTLDGSEDIAWADSVTLVSGKGSALFAWRRGDAAWKQIGDFAFAGITSVTRLAVSPNGQWLAVVGAQRARTALALGAAASFPDKVDPAMVQRGMNILAADSMEGRATGSVGQERAAKWLEAQYKAIGLTPAGDSGTFRQHIPLKAQSVMPGASGAARRPRPTPVASWSEWRTLPVEQRMRTSNVAGMIRGSDPALRNEVVLVTAHYDHIGIGAPVNGDSINNGADDDASGNIALVEIARALMKGPRPKRTILFMSITGEEVGGFGTRWYMQHPLLPLENTVVDLNIEMIAHPDTLTGGFGKAWVTGYERSTLGDLLADNGIGVVPDPRPAQNFFTRSDNAAFARIGIPAHSISSYNLVTPYHNPKDEASIINAPHMARVIEATARAVRLLGDGPKPAWHPGGKPEARPAR